VTSELPPYDPTVTWVRHCDRCGAIDDSERWASQDEALAATAGETRWRCPSCGHGNAVVKPAAKLGGG
jgi:hypothetical protein